MSEASERIIAAAVLRGGVIHTMPSPARHHTIMQAVDLVYGDKHLPFRPDEQGFLTDKGRFVGRFEAKDIARHAGQLLQRAEKLPELYSEDVW